MAHKACFENCYENISETLTAGNVAKSYDYLCALILKKRFLILKKR